MGETEFNRRHQCPPRSLAAFEKSDFADDWRELMRLYLVRRTRSFVQDNYAETDPANGRKFLTFEDGGRSYFPTRIPKTVKFKINDKDPSDQYARLYADHVVDALNRLTLPRYGLGNYLAPSPHAPPSQAEAKVIQDLSRAGKRLMGFCRTNLFKRLESSGQAFIQSVERHVLRNCICLYAIDNELPLPIGTQDAELLDSRFSDDDESALFENEDDGNGNNVGPPSSAPSRNEADYQRRAGEVYADYAAAYRRRFKWLRPGLFVKGLAEDLRTDARALLDVLKSCGEWDPNSDSKLDALWKLLTVRHPNEKILLFSQFADTVRYLETQLQVRGLMRVGGATGDSPDPTALAWWFSPESNQKRSEVLSDQELRVLVATDVLSEGQNLQDSAVVVNYDLPWAIIRLVQRAGRVDRIGQKAEKILCYSFLPAEGVERIIRLRARVRQRLTENAEVVGADEQFFEDLPAPQAMRDLFTEKAGILDGDADTDVDLASYAYQIWKNAISADATLQKTIPELPPVVYATRAHQPTPKEPGGALVYLRTAEGNDALAWMDTTGNSVTESQFTILKAAECAPETPPLPRQINHHSLVQKAVELIVTEEKSVGGQLGRPSGAAFAPTNGLNGTPSKSKGRSSNLRSSSRRLTRSTAIRCGLPLSIR